MDHPTIIKSESVSTLYKTLNVPKGQTTALHSALAVYVSPGLRQSNTTPAICHLICVCSKPGLSSYMVVVGGT